MKLKIHLEIVVITPEQSIHALCQGIKQVLEQDNNKITSVDVIGIWVIERDHDDGSINDGRD